MIMEDDAVPVRNFTSNLGATAEQLPEDWDVLRMLGCSDEPHTNSSWVDHRLRVHRRGGHLPEIACIRPHCFYSCVSLHARCGQSCPA